MALHGAGLTNSVEELTAAFGEANALVVDIRTAEENTAGPSVPGATLATWDRDNGQFVDGVSLPTEKSTPMIVH